MCVGESPIKHVHLHKVVLVDQSSEALYRFEYILTLGVSGFYDHELKSLIVIHGLSPPYTRPGTF